MDENLRWLFQSLSLLGLGPGACLVQMEADGIALRQALEAILAGPHRGALTPALGKARCGAGLAQGRPKLFPVLGRILEEEGIHKLSMLNWDGWDPDLALGLLGAHWQGPGRLPLPLIGVGHVSCAGLTMLPHGLRLQRLRLAHCRELRNLPAGLEVQESLECWHLGLRRIPDSLFCGGNLLLVDLPFLDGWGADIWIKGDLVMSRTPRKAEPPQGLRMEGKRRVPDGRT